MNKVVKKILYSIIIFLAIIVIKNKSDATSISFSPSNPKVGDTVTVTVTVPNVHTVTVTANVSGAVNGTIKLVNGDMGGEAKSYSASGQYKCEKEGTISVNISGDSRAILNGNDVEVGASASVKVASAQTSTSTSTSTNNNQPAAQTTEKSSNASLSNLGIKPNDFSGFKSSNTSYSTTVPYETESIEVYASKGQNGQTITGTGKKTLQEGQNKIDVTVTAEDGKTKKTYTINVTRKSKDDTSEEEKTEENTEGNTEEQENEEKAEEPLLGLAELKIKGIELNPEFKTDVYEYNVELNQDIDKLDLSAIASIQGANVEIIGNEDFEEGENIITIIVTSEDGEKTIVYVITVNKKLVSDEIVNNNKTLKDYIPYIVVGVLIFISIIVIIIKRRKNNFYEDEDENEYYNNDNTFSYNNDNDYKVTETEQEEYNTGKETDVKNEENNTSKIIPEEFFEEPAKERKKRSKGKRFK